MEIYTYGKAAFISSGSPKDTYKTLFPPMWEKYLAEQYHQNPENAIKRPEEGKNWFEQVQLDLNRSYCHQNSTLLNNAAKIIGQAPYTQLFTCSSQFYELLNICLASSQNINKNFNALIFGQDVFTIVLTWFSDPNNKGLFSVNVVEIRIPFGRVNDSIIFTSVHSHSKNYKNQNKSFNLINEERMYCGKQWLPAFAHYLPKPKEESEFSKKLQKHLPKFSNLGSWKNSLKNSRDCRQSLFKMLYEDPAAQHALPFLHDLLSLNQIKKDKLEPLAQKYGWIHGNKIKNVKNVLFENSMATFKNKMSIELEAFIAKLNGSIFSTRLKIKNIHENLKELDKINDNNVNFNNLKKTTDGLIDKLASKNGNLVNCKMLKCVLKFLLIRVIHKDDDSYYKNLTNYILKNNKALLQLRPKLYKHLPMVEAYFVAWFTKNFDHAHDIEEHGKYVDQGFFSNWIPNFNPSKSIEPHIKKLKSSKSKLPIRAKNFIINYHTKKGHIRVSHSEVKKKNKLGVIN